MFKKHTDTAFAATILAGGMILLSSTALVSPYWLWLNDQPGTTSAGAETQLDRYQGLWYSCEFVIEGTISGVNIERRNCTGMADLVDGVSRPASIMTVQAFTWIGEIFTVLTVVAVWVGLGSANKPKDATNIAKTMYAGAAFAALTALAQFIALLTYVADDYVTATRTNAINPALIGWGSGVGCIATSFVCALIVVILAAISGVSWAAESTRMSQPKRAPAAAAAPAAAPAAAAVADVEAPAPAETEEEAAADTAHAAIVAEVDDEPDAEEAAAAEPASEETAAAEPATEEEAAAAEGKDEADAAAEEDDGKAASA